MLTFTAAGNGDGVYDTNPANDSVSIAVLYAVGEPVGSASLIVPGTVLAVLLIASRRMSRRLPRAPKQGGAGA